MVETIFNGGEAILWLAFAVVVAVRFHHAPRGARRTARAMAAFFVVFAVSDVIEMRTGAWWRPLSLLILKATCLTGLTWCFVALARGMRADAASRSVPPGTDRSLWELQKQQRQQLLSLHKDDHSEATPPKSSPDSD